MVAEIIPGAAVVATGASYLLQIRGLFENLSSIPIDDRYEKENLKQTQLEQISHIEAIEKFIANHIQEKNFQEKIHMQLIPALSSVTTLKNVAKETPTITSSESKSTSTLRL